MKKILCTVLTEGQSDPPGRVVLQFWDLTTVLKIKNAVISLDHCAKDQENCNMYGARCYRFNFKIRYSWAKYPKSVKLVFIPPCT